MQVHSVTGLRQNAPALELLLAASGKNSNPAPAQSRTEAERRASGGEAKQRWSRGQAKKRWRGEDRC